MSVVFIGGGRITSALLAGLRLSKYKQRVIVHDRNVRKLGDLKKTYGVKIEGDLHRAVAQADLLIIAVRPDAVANLLRHVGRVDRPLTVVSLAAGIPLSKLRNTLGPAVHWTRAMPSPAARSGRGLTALSFGRNVPVRERHRILQFFSEVGPVLEIPESKFDAFTVTYSSSHGYHALANLAAAGQELGLDRRTSLTAAAHALADGIVAWREGDVSLEELLAEATTPGGIAATVMKAMDRAGYPRAIEKGLRAGLVRARENAK